ncbi:MAG: hypothetical protein M1419_07620 [Bacteroidetes bacterium]|nr:hypothetical protein [Bacteroidota bacterium]
MNISVHLIGDISLNKTDIAILISADSDLVPAIEFINENFNEKKIKVYFPPSNSSTDLFNAINRKVVFLDNNKYKFENSIMPDIVYDKDKTDFATIPQKWKI